MENSKIILLTGKLANIRAAIKVAQKIPVTTWHELEGRNLVVIPLLDIRDEINRGLKCLSAV